METYCVTALEAALSKTLVITNNLAGLSDTVGNRGIIVEGDPMTLEWRNKVLDVLRKDIVQDRKEYIHRMDIVHRIIDLNYDYVFNMSWDNIVKKLIGLCK
jgi:glycosyltransferase involved in cell wall biosynthesis